MLYDDMVEQSGKEVFEQYGQIRTFAPNQVIYERGGPAEYIYFLAEGQVRTYFLSPDGHEITLFYINANNTFCNESLIAYHRTVANVCAATEAQVWSLRAEKFLDGWLSSGFSYRDLIGHLSRRAMLLSDYLCCTRFSKSEERVAYFLYSMHSDGSADHVCYTHEQIAAMTNMSKPTVDRILKRFEEDRLISCKYGKIQICDAKGLAERFNYMGYVIE